MDPAEVTETNSEALRDERRCGEAVEPEVDPVSTQTVLDDSEAIVSDPISAAAIDGCDATEGTDDVVDSGDVQEEGVDGGDLRSTSVPRCDNPNSMLTDAATAASLEATDADSSEVVVVLGSSRDITTGTGGQLECDSNDNSMGNHDAPAPQSVVEFAEEAAEERDTPKLPHVNTQYTFEVQLHTEVAPLPHSDTADGDGVLASLDNADHDNGDIELGPVPQGASEPVPAVPSAAEVRVLEENVEKLANDIQSLRNYLDVRLDRVHINLSAFSEKIDVVNESNLDALRKQQERCSEQVSEAYDSLAGALRDTASCIDADIQRSTSRIETELRFLVDQVSERVAAVQASYDRSANELSDRFQLLDHRFDQLSLRLDEALRMEMLPPAAPLPTEGTRMRLVISIDFASAFAEGCDGAQHVSVLLPVCSSATVGMVKREVLRRAMQQGTVPVSLRNTFVYSNTVAILDNMTLFEDDTLDDIGITPSDKIIIRCTKKVVATPTSQFGREITITAFPNALGTVEVVQEPVEVVTSVPSVTLRPSASSADSPAVRDVTLEPVFLNPQDAERIADQENMERRLMHELARMELTPLLHEASLKRAGIAKAAADKLRITLLDRCTYSHDEYERRVARGALEKINEVLSQPLSTPETIEIAIRSARNVLQSISSNAGEADRVSAIEATAAAERNRKDRLVEDIKDIVFRMRHQLRIPSQLFSRAESLLFSADRAIMLAPTSTPRELDAVHKELVEFVDSLRS